MVKDVGLEGVVDRRQPADEGLQPVEIGRRQGRVVTPVVVGPRLQFGDVACTKAV